MLDLEFLANMLKCQEKASECLKYGKIIWRVGLGELTALFSQLTASTL